jgi:methylated-DNA-[protein]-cysteine S-methyltransferase
MLESLQFDTPLGPMIAVGSPRAVHGLYFAGQRHMPDLSGCAVDSGCLLLHRARRQVEEYFAGRRQRFELPLDHSGTALQQSVWAALGTIAYGQTVSYAALAEQVGRPAAVRAVAQAVGRNPWIILRPCHRVVASSGALTGFAAGLERKSALLALESRPGRQPAQSG